MPGTVWLRLASGMDTSKSVFGALRNKLHPNDPRLKVLVPKHKSSGARLWKCLYRLVEDPCVPNRLPTVIHLNERPYASKNALTLSLLFHTRWVEKENANFRRLHNTDKRRWDYT